MAAAVAIVIAATDQPASSLAWMLFSVLVVCGLGTILQTRQFGRFGSGYPVTLASGAQVVAVSISGLLGGGPAMLSTLILVSTLIQFAFIARLALLRLIITPVVSGTVLMLLAATIMTVLFGQLSNLPEGGPHMAAPILAGMPLGILMGVRLFASAKWQQWAPIVAVLAGTALSAYWGLYDYEKVAEASWVGIPAFSWAGFDLSFGSVFWGLLPGFAIVYLASTLNSVSDTVVMQQVAWRRPRATDFRVVQGAHNLMSLANVLAALLGTLPNMIRGANSATIILTGVASRRVGVYAGLLMIAVAFSPKLIAVVVAIPITVLVAYLIFLLVLMFMQGMNVVFRDGVDRRKAAIVGVSLWIGVGFQNQNILPDLLTGTAGTLLSNGMTPGALCVIFLTLLTEFTSGRRKRLNVEMKQSSLPQIDAFLMEFATKAHWNSASVDRLRSAGEETLSSLLSQEEEQGENVGQRLVVSARRRDGKIELDFMVTSEGENLEDRLAYLGEQPEINDEREISFRLLRHYASSVQHRKYHDIDIITVEVAASA